MAVEQPPKEDVLHAPATGRPSTLACTACMYGVVRNKTKHSGEPGSTVERRLQPLLDGSTHWGAQP